SDNVTVRIHPVNRHICVGMAGKSDGAETAGVDHVSMPFSVGAGVSANDDSIPAHIADTCANGTRKHKSGEPALIQQKSMACVFAVKESSRDASQIIQCGSLAVRGRR